MGLDIPESHTAPGVDNKKRDNNKHLEIRRNKERLPDGYVPHLAYVNSKKDTLSLEKERSNLAHISVNPFEPVKFKHLETEHHLKRNKPNQGARHTPHLIKTTTTQSISFRFFFFLCNFFVFEMAI